MLPWMSASGDSRTSTSELHYVVDDTWHPSLIRPGFDALCGARVLPLWGAYDDALATRPRCADCERIASSSRVTLLAAGVGSRTTHVWLADVQGECTHWVHVDSDSPVHVAVCGAACTSASSHATPSRCASCVASATVDLGVRRPQGDC